MGSKRKVEKYIFPQTLQSVWHCWIFLGGYMTYILWLHTRDAGGIFSLFCTPHSPQVLTSCAKIVRAKIKLGSIIIIQQMLSVSTLLLSFSPCKIDILILALSFLRWICWVTFAMDQGFHQINIDELFRTKTGFRIACSFALSKAHRPNQANPFPFTHHYWL